MRAFQIIIYKLISQSNLLQFFTKIHPVITKRVKPWPLVEIYCLQFLIDFTYYEEGQLCVPKVRYREIYELKKRTEVYNINKFNFFITI